LSVDDILAWADAFHKRNGRCPKVKAGPIPEAPGETWMRVGTALAEALRGLSSRFTLPQLLSERRGVRNHLRLPHLNVKQIVKWARAHKRRTGRWPTPESGPVHGAEGETWKAVAMALLQGLRGLPGGSSLPRLRQEVAAGTQR
jgi:hypothetical protein